SAVYAVQVIYCLMKTRSCERVFGFYEDIRRLTRHCETDNGIVAPPARHCETDNGTVTPSVRHCGFNNDRITDLSPHCSSHNDPSAIIFDQPNKKTNASHAPCLILINLLIYSCVFGSSTVKVEPTPSVLFT